MTDVPVSIPSSPSAADYAAEGDRPLIPDTDKPFDLLELWLKEANEHEPNDSTAMSLATVDADEMPDVRIVLLRGLSAEDGLQFYTNYDSAKGVQLAARPKAAICFHWKSLRRQVRVRGTKSIMRHLSLPVLNLVPGVLYKFLQSHKLSAG